MDVGTATGSYAIGDNLLKHFEPTVVITEHRHLARELAHQVGEAAVGTEHQVARTGIVADRCSYSVGNDLCSLQAVGKNAVGAEIGRQRIAPVGSEASTVDVSVLLAR